ncbi:hypothetical protein RUM43_005645 [Polyplax serrata]|uniref:Uncharacterized protein n=1 Tax=Polyplax serrata TaxID=468196 RepID=A0AAN8P099_POLSC
MHIGSNLEIWREDLYQKTGRLKHKASIITDRFHDILLSRAPDSLREGKEDDPFSPGDKPLSPSTKEEEEKEDRSQTIGPMWYSKKRDEKQEKHKIDSATEGICFCRPEKTERKMAE